MSIDLRAHFVRLFVSSRIIARRLRHDLRDRRLLSGILCLRLFQFLPSLFDVAAGPQVRVVAGLFAFR
jgi:hypothetical protein